MRRTEPEYGDIRVKRKFLWTPRINPMDGRDWRWLEFVTVTQQYRHGCWLAIRWLEDNDEME